MYKKTLYEVNVGGSQKEKYFLDVFESDRFVSLEHTVKYTRS